MKNRVFRRGILAAFSLVVGSPCIAGAMDDLEFSSEQLLGVSSNTVGRSLAKSCLRREIARPNAVS